MAGNVILLPLTNPTDFYAGTKQVVPEDGINLNRAFPGNAKGSLSARLAVALENALYPVADFLADLHGGDYNEVLHPLVFFPTSGDAAINRTSLIAAQTLTVPYRVRSSARNGLYSWAAQCGIPALLVERGDRGLWSEKEVAACRENVYELMRHLGILHVDMVSSCFPQTEIRKAIYKEAPADGFWYPAVSEAGQKLKQGALLGTLKDSYGNEIARYTAPFEGVVLYYTLSLGVRSRDPLIAYGKL